MITTIIVNIFIDHKLALGARFKCIFTTAFNPTLFRKVRKFTRRLFSILRGYFRHCDRQKKHRNWMKIILTCSKLRLIYKFYATSGIILKLSIKRDFISFIFSYYLQIFLIFHLLFHWFRYAITEKNSSLSFSGNCIEYCSDFSSIWVCSFKNKTSHVLSS